MPPKPIITLNTLKVLGHLYNNMNDQHYGLSLSKSTGLGNGTLYPILDKLEDAKLITATWEKIDPHVAGRRPRRFYNLTGEGVKMFETQRANLFGNVREISLA